MILIYLFIYQIKYWGDFHVFPEKFKKPPHRTGATASLNRWLALTFPSQKRQSCHAELNRKPAAYKAATLPVELQQLVRLPLRLSHFFGPLQRRFHQPLSSKKQFSAAIVILCEVNRNAHISKARPCILGTTGFEPTTS